MNHLLHRLYPGRHGGARGHVPADSIGDLPMSPAGGVQIALQTASPLRPSAQSDSVSLSGGPTSPRPPLTDAQLEVLEYRAAAAVAAGAGVVPAVSSSSTESASPSPTIVDVGAPGQRSSFLRQLTHHRSLSALKGRSRKGAKGGDREPSAGTDAAAPPTIKDTPTPGNKQSTNTTPRRKMRRKSSLKLKPVKSALSLSSAPWRSVPKSPVPPLPTRRVSLEEPPKASALLHSADRSRGWSPGEPPALSPSSLEDKENIPVTPSTSLSRHSRDRGSTTGVARGALSQDLATSKLQPRGPLEDRRTAAILYHRRAKSDFGMRPLRDLPAREQEAVPEIHRVPKHFQFPALPPVPPHNDLPLPRLEAHHGQLASRPTQHPHPAPLPLTASESLALHHSSDAQSPPRSYPSWPGPMTPSTPETISPPFPYDPDGEPIRAVTPVPLSHIGTPNPASSRCPSPFEVKFSPEVTRRISLEAFGTTLGSIHSHLSHIERLTEENSGDMSAALDSSLDFDAEDFVPVDEPSRPFQLRAISTIHERPRPTSWGINDGSPRPTRVSPFSESAVHDNSPPAPLSHGRSYSEGSFPMLNTYKRRTRELEAAQALSELSEGNIMSGTVSPLALESEPESPMLRPVLQEGDKAPQHAAYLINKAKLEALQVEHERLTTTHNQVKAELQTVKTQNEAEKTALLTSEESRSALIASLATLQGANIDERRKWMALEAANIALRNQLEAQAEDHQFTLEEKDRQVKQTALRANEKDAIISQLEKKLDSLEFSVAEAQVTGQAKVQELLGQLAEVEVANEERGSRLQEALEELKSLQSDQEKWTDERDELIERVWMAEHDRETSDTVLFELKSQLSGSAGELLALKKDILDLGGKVADSKVALEHQTAALHNAENQAATAQEERDRANRDAERAMRASNDAIASLQDDKAALAARVGDLTNELELVRLEADGQKSRATSYLVEVERLQHVEASLKTRVNELLRRSASESLDLANMGKELDKTREDFKMLQVEVASKDIQIALGTPPRKTTAGKRPKNTPARGTPLRRGDGN